MNEKDMLNDSLSSQKQIESNYNTFANECVNPQIRNDFINILKDEHDIQYHLFTEAKKRGWYQVPPADATKITQAKQKFTQAQ